MWCAVGVGVGWCRSSLSRLPMLRREGKQRGRRCRVLFSDLKALLLRPPPPQPPAPLAMNGAPSAHGASPMERTRDEGSPVTAAASAAQWATEAQRSATESPDGGSSSEDCTKEKFDERASLESCTESGTPTPLCRICFQGADQGELLSPCRCSGSVRCTHEPCLIKWISERGSWSCELCYYKYQVIAISTKNPLQWQTISLTVIEKVQIAAAVLGSLFLIASISWLVWSSLSPSAKWQRQDLLFQICYAMYGFMDLVCIALIVHEGPSVFRIFHRWQAVNQQWKVLNYDKLKDSEDPQKGSSTLRSLTLPMSNRGGVAPPTSPSPSGSTLTTTATVTVTPGTTVPVVPGAPEDSSEAESHCAYSLLQLLSLNLRNQEPRNAMPQPRNDNRELVMRVTTV
ncbi:E3 ubiquitin-protein ligase MARCH4 [Bagarius yarrelli]|uniref:RING-type E3 ubiquitin transferase n=1 Tax=Bagarius yarrelli TaxID=175774 RepID=A0A556TKT6_BAGYA|nr:E3 ubiquitin-protein ligase MARCH4 [Bagarius yarrelli]